MGAKRQGERQRCRVKVKPHDMASLPCATRPSFCLYCSLLYHGHIFPLDLPFSFWRWNHFAFYYRNCRCILTGGLYAHGFFFFFLLLCVILLPTSHHPCAATATLNNDTTFSLSPAFSPLTLSCLFFAYCFYYFFPFSPSVKLAFFFFHLLLLHSFLLIT